MHSATFLEMRLGAGTDIYKNFEESFDLFLGFLGPFMFVIIQFASLKTALSIKEAKSTCQYSQLPFLALFTNCLVWTVYGLCKLNFTVIIPNSTGIATAAYCIYIYETHSNKHIPLNYYLLSLITVIMVLILGCLTATETIGILGDTLSVLMMFSPLTVLFTVMREKSTRALPFLTSCASFGNTLTWTVYGVFVANDPIIYVPNVLGFIFSSFQMYLFSYYGVHMDTDGYEYASGIDEKVEDDNSMSLLNDVGRIQK